MQKKETVTYHDMIGLISMNHDVMIKKNVKKESGVILSVVSQHLLPSRCELPKVGATV